MSLNSFSSGVGVFVATCLSLCIFGIMEMSLKCAEDTTKEDTVIQQLAEDVGKLQLSSQEGEVDAKEQEIDTKEQKVHTRI